MLLCLPAAVRAQIDPAGSVRGVVRDEHGAVLRGATIVATGPEAPLPYESASDATGGYRLTDMQPGAYRITVTADGFATLMRDDIRVRAGLNVGLDLIMRVGGVGETVVVAGDAPMLETRSPTTALNFSGAFQRSLPLSLRPQWYDFLRATPSSSLSETIYGASFWVNGSDSTSLVVQVDGADIGGSAQSSTAYLKATPYIIQDVQIKTAGAEASAPLGQGAVINMVTRSGTNRLSGAAALRGQSRRWASNNNPGGTAATYDTMQPDVALGGPLVRDRLWFFGAYHYNNITTGVNRLADRLAIARVLVPGYVPFDNQFTGHQLFGKISWQTAPASRFEAQYFSGEDIVRAGGPQDTATFASAKSGGRTVSVSMQTLWRQRTAIRALVTFNDQTYSTELLSLAKPGRSVHLTTSLVGGTIVGNGAVAVLDNIDYGYQSDAPAAKLTAAVDVSRPATFWGQHDLRVGAYLQPRRLVKYRQRYPAGGFAIEELVFRDPANLALGVVPFHRQIMDRETIDTTSVNSQDYAGYVQDTWQMASRLTLTAGLRMDFIKRRDLLFDTTVQRTLAVGPRIGLRYRWDEGRSVLRGSWVRLHDAVSNGSGTTVGSGTAGFTDLYDTDLDGVFETSRFTPGVTSRTANRFIDLDTFRQPSVDEASVGITRQWPGQFSVDVGGVYRRYRDRTATIDVNSIYEGGRFVGYRDEAFNEILMVASNVYNEPVYSALDIHFTKQTARLQMVGGYTRQWRHLEGGWQPNDPAAIIQPDAFPNDRGIGALSRITRNSLSGTDLTQGSQWRDHVVRAMISARLPWSVNLAVSYWGQAGPWSGPIVTRIARSDPAFGPATITLGNGRVVSNPLATTIRFAYPTRGEGQTRLAAIHALNMKVGRDVVWRRATIRPSIEIFNLLNRGAFYDYLFMANQLYNPNAGRGTSVQLPRSVQLSVAMTF